MFNWVSSSNTETKTYGKKKGNSSSFLPAPINSVNNSESENLQNASKPRIFDFDSIFSTSKPLPLEEEDSSIKRIKQERTGKGLKDSSIEPKSSAFSRPPNK